MASTILMRPRSELAEDVVACAIDCLSKFRDHPGGSTRCRAECVRPADIDGVVVRCVRESLSAIRPRLAALDAEGRLPDEMLAKVDEAIGQELEDLWTAPASDTPKWGDGRDCEGE